jgi:hypothetical protein
MRRASTLWVHHSTIRKSKSDTSKNSTLPFHWSGWAVHLVHWHVRVQQHECRDAGQQQFGNGVPRRVDRADHRFGSQRHLAFGGADPTKNPVTTISGNSLNQGSKTFDFDSNTLPAGQRFDCVETITEAVSGSLVANDQAQVTLTYDSIRKSGAACTAQNLGYKVHPCASTLTFIGRKQ